MGTIATELLEAKRDEHGRRITPAAERENVVRAYTESGLTQKAFAKKEGLKYSTFVSWVQGHRRQSSRAKVGFAVRGRVKTSHSGSPPKPATLCGVLLRSRFRRG